MWLCNIINTYVTSKRNEVWYVDFGASNHMTSHKEWFSYLEKPEQLGFVKTGDDAPHTMSDRRGSWSTSCMSRQSQRTLYRLDRLSIKGCRLGSHTSDASSKKRAKFSRRGTEKGRCLSTKQTKSNRDVCKRAKGRVGYQKVLLSSYEVKYDLWDQKYYISRDTCERE